MNDILILILAKRNSAPKMSVQKLLEELEKHREILSSEDFSQIETILEKYKAKTPEISFEQELKNIEEASRLKEEGNLHFKSADYLGAIEKYTLAIEKDPKNKLLYSNRSACYAKLGQTEESIADAQKSIELDPFYAKGYYRLGTFYSTIDPEKSLACFEKALECEPSNSEYKQFVNSAKEKLTNPTHNLNEPTDQSSSWNSQAEKMMQDPAFKKQVDEMMKNPNLSSWLKEFSKNKSSKEMKELEKNVQDYSKNKK